MSRDDISLIYLGCWLPLFCFQRFQTYDSLFTLLFIVEVGDRSSGISVCRARPVSAGLKPAYAFTGAAQTGSKKKKKKKKKDDAWRAKLAAFDFVLKVDW